MLKVGLTGGIATGKSYVLARLIEAGVPVVDADVLARRAVGPGMPALQAIRARFGDAVLDPDGSLNRGRLADIVFRDAAARRALEAMIHPGVMQAIEEFFTRTTAAGAVLAVADIPLLYETGVEATFDRIVVAACPPEMQIARVMARDRTSREAAERRVVAQLPIDEKVRRAHYVIHTDGTFDDTNRQIAEVLEQLRNEA